MRNVICAMNLSIDGCYDHTKISGDEEILEYFTHIMQDVDQIITGRKMHELMVPYWTDVAKNQSGTKAANAYANTTTVINTMVLSRTMEQVEGGPQILRGNLEEEVLRLKSLPGKKISIGGMSLRSQLMAAGLIDEFYFVVHPVIVGTGPRLLESFGLSLSDTMKLNLVDYKILESGCAALHYLK